MNFSEALRNESKFTRTENGALALNTTGDACLDLFSTIGSLRNADENRIYTLFEEAYKENPLYATKIVFYGRDIRGGLVEKVLFNGEQSDVIEAQWDALPDYVEKGTNALVMADVSVSMYGRPLATSIGLALYFAERNEGAYHNLFMTFSERPNVVSIKGDTITQKIRNINKAYWDMNTDLEAAFDEVLSIAIKNNIPSEEMVKSIIVVSDMEIDYCTSNDWTFYDFMKKKYNDNGYDIPNIVFWNVNSRNDIFHSDKDRKGVQFCSGQSVSVFKQLMNSIGKTPVEMMESVINSERYLPITIYDDGFDETLFS